MGGSLRRRTVLATGVGVLAGLTGCLSGSPARLLEAGIHAYDLAGSGRSWRRRSGASLWNLAADGDRVYVGLGVPAGDEGE